MDRKPKPGDRFLHASVLDNQAFAKGRRDVYAECVVTSVRAWPDSVTVFYTFADQWDGGVRQGSQRFELDYSEGTVGQWLPQPSL